MKPEPTVAIIGATFWGNRGAEAMLTTTLGILRQRLPGCRFKVFSYYPQHDRGLVQAQDIEILSASPKALIFKLFLPALLWAPLRRAGAHGQPGVFPRAFGALCQADILLDLGGITFVDGREKYLPFNILTVLPAMLLGVPVVKLSQAMGPFKRTLNRTAARAILKRCAHVFARGEITAEHLRQLGLAEGRWSRAADVAFGYLPEYSLTKENEALVGEVLGRLEDHRRAGEVVLGVNPSAVMVAQATRAGRDHLGEIVAALKGLGEDHPGRRFVVFPNATRQGTVATHNNDIPLIQSLRSRLAEVASGDLAERVLWIDFDVNTRAIRELLWRCDVLVTSRFHAMVAGLALGIPTLVLGWSHKYLEVLSAFQQDANNLDVKDWVEVLPPLVDDLLAGRRPPPPAEALGRVVESSRSQFERVVRLLA